MEDHKSPVAADGFMFRATDDGEWENLGYVDEGGISFASDSDEEELDRWHEALLKLNDPVSFRIKLPWYMENEWYRYSPGVSGTPCRRCARAGRGTGRTIESRKQR